MSACHPRELLRFQTLAPVLAVFIVCLPFCVGVGINTCQYLRWQVSPEPQRITGALSSTDLDEIKTIAHREIFKVYHSLAGHSVKSVEVTSNLMVDRLSRAPDGKVIRSLEVTTNLSVDVSYVDNESLFGECTMMLEKGANGWTFIAHNCR